MGIFSKIRDKIFGHDDQKASNGAPAPATNVQTASPTPPATTPPASPAAAKVGPRSQVRTVETARAPRLHAPAPSAPMHYNRWLMVW